jgi:hypothetical protein
MLPSRDSGARAFPQSCGRNGTFLSTGSVENSGNADSPPPPAALPLRRPSADDPASLSAHPPDAEHAQRPRPQEPHRARRRNQHPAPAGLLALYARRHCDPSKSAARASSSRRTRATRASTPEDIPGGADEGDVFNEEIRVGSDDYVIDPTVFQALPVSPVHRLGRTETSQ